MSGGAAVKLDRVAFSYGEAEMAFDLAVGSGEIVAVMGPSGPALRQDMAELLRVLHGETGMTTLLVTHSPEDALGLAPRLVFLENGTVAADGPTQELLGPGGPAAVAAYAGSLPGR